MLILSLSLGSNFKLFVVLQLMRILERGAEAYLYCQWPLFDKVVNVNVADERVFHQILYSVLDALIVVCNSEDDCRYWIEFVFSECLCREEALGKSALSNPF